MALTPKKETVGAVYDVFVKVFELFTGGFSISPDGFNKDVKLPKGSLLKVDEDDRTATPIKTAVLTATAAAEASGLFVESGHHFQVGDHIALDNGGSAHQITVADDEYIAIEDKAGDNLGTGVPGDVLFHAGGTADAGSAEIDTKPNGILRYDTTIATGEFATVAIRGTVYKNRIQDHIDDHLDDLSHIHFSESK